MHGLKRTTFYLNQGVIMEFVLGVVGGSGIYELEGLSDLKEVKVSTPFGEPSDAYLCGQFSNGTKIVFLPRHARGHKLLPSEINYRANVYGFKKLGVNWLLSVSAVGSLKEEIEPGHLVAPDQFFDRTFLRKNTFLGDGVVGHVPFGDPTCSVLRSNLIRSAKEVGEKIHDGGTYVCMEGPLFSSRAESNFYRSLNASVIGMTNLPEAKLAREAGMSYASLSLATDYDCWHETQEDVSAHAVLEVMSKNVIKAKKVLKQLALSMEAQESPYRALLKTCIVTQKDLIPAKTFESLELLMK